MAVFEDIREWIAGRPRWEQAALYKLLTQDSLTNKDYDEIVEILLEEGGLMPATARKEYKWVEPGIAPGKVLLKRLFDLKNVNALVEGQSLFFGEQLTLVFGVNRAGKSGYTRVLACAAAARAYKNTSPLPNVFDKDETLKKLEAKIEIEEGGKTDVLIYDGENRCPELNNVYVFDNKSAEIHVEGETEITFSPAGLIYLKRLVDVVKEIGERIDLLIESKTPQNIFIELFENESPVKDLISGLSEKTNKEKLGALAKWGEVEESRVKETEGKITELKALDIAKKKVELKKDHDAVEKLVSLLTVVDEKLSKNAEERIRGLLLKKAAEDKIRRAASIDRFSAGPFTCFGSKEWETFLSAARELGKVESEGRTQYPDTGDDCLLCRQRLKPEAITLLRGLWDYVDTAGSPQANIPAVELKNEAGALTQLDLSFFDENTILRDIINKYNGVLTGSIEGYLRSAEARKESLLKLITGNGLITIAEMKEIPLDPLQTLLGAVQEKADQLDAGGLEKELAELVSEHRLLKHRRILNANLSRITEYIDNLSWVSRVKKLKPSSDHITWKTNQLFDKYIGEDYLRVFENTLAELDFPLEVTVETYGREGEKRKRLRLKPRNSEVSLDYKLSEVFSEGEKQAVAIADFLSEVKVNPDSSAVIFDDPVTSLDDRWRENLARKLCFEAKERQVIVFTHELGFVYFLNKSARELGIIPFCHCIERHVVTDLPGVVHRDSIPLHERNYKSAEKARERYANSLKPDLSPEERRTELTGGFVSLRMSYEYLVIYKLFGGVVLRFEPRVSIDRLSNCVMDYTIVQEIIEGTGRVSRYLHLLSEEVTTPPIPRDLLDEIDAWEDLKRRISDARPS